MAKFVPKNNRVPSYFFHRIRVVVEGVLVSHFLWYNPVDQGGKREGTARHDTHVENSDSERGRDRVRNEREEKGGLFTKGAGGMGSDDKQPHHHPLPPGELEGRRAM